MEQITSSINLFVDSSQGHNAESEGDDYNVNLQDANIKCGDGEHFRMTLNNFSMAKNFHDVNENNNEFRIMTRHSTFVCLLTSGVVFLQLHSIIFNNTFYFL